MDAGITSIDQAIASDIAIEFLNPEVRILLWIAAMLRTAVPETELRACESCCSSISKMGRQLTRDMRPGAQVPPGRIRHSVTRARTSFAV